MKTSIFFIIAIVAFLMSCTMPVNQISNSSPSAKAVVGADLTIAGIHYSLASENYVRVTYTVTNLGSVPVDKTAITVQALISKDKTYSDDDIPAGGATIDWEGQLAPGASEDHSFGFTPKEGTIPSVPSDVRYLVVKVDSLNVLAETSETNNVANVRLLPFRPDLVVTNIYAIYPTDTEIDYTFTILNKGVTPADTSQLVVQGSLLKNGFFDRWAGGVLIGASMLHPAPLLPGESFTYTVPCPFENSVDGNDPHWLDEWSDQSLSVTVDEQNAVAESDESNNTMDYLIHKAGEVTF